MTMMMRYLIGMILLASLSATVSSHQVVPLSRVMREKLTHSQKILEAVVTSNWAELEQHSIALRRATEDPAWAALTRPEYVRQSETFLRASDDLVDAAKRRDLEMAPVAYVSLTLSCVQCHRYIARMRIAK